METLVEKLETTYVPEEGKTYHSIDGTIFRIGKHDVDFLSKLQALKPRHRIELMLLNEDEINEAIDAIKTLKANEILTIYHKNWLWKETGDPVDFSELIPHISYYEIKTKFRKGYRKLSIQQIDDILNVFTADHSEIYLKPEKELI